MTKIHHTDSGHVLSVGHQQQCQVHTGGAAIISSVRPGRTNEREHDMTTVMLNKYI